MRQGAAGGLRAGRRCLLMVAAVRRRAQLAAAPPAEAASAQTAATGFCCAGCSRGWRPCRVGRDAVSQGGRRARSAVMAIVSSARARGADVLGMRAPRPELLTGAGRAPAPGFGRWSGGRARRTRRAAGRRSRRTAQRLTRLLPGTASCVAVEMDLATAGVGAWRCSGERRRRFEPVARRSPDGSAAGAGALAEAAGPGSGRRWEAAAQSVLGDLLRRCSRRRRTGRRPHGLLVGVAAAPGRPRRARARRGALRAARRAASAPLALALRACT
jgi:hypothetical protein